MKMPDPTAPVFDKARDRQQYHRDLAEQKRIVLEDLDVKERRERNGRVRTEEPPYQFRSTHSKTARP
jgi:hypothetical protein